MVADQIPDADRQEQDEPPTADRYEGHRARPDQPEADVLEQETPVQSEDEAMETEAEPRSADERAEPD